MSDIRIPRGNTFYTRVTVVAVDAATRTPISGFSLNDCTDLHVYYIRRNKQTEITNYSILDGNRLRIKWLGTDMKIGGYGLEATGIYNGLEWRFYNTDRYVFSIVESNEEANIPPSAFIETDYYAINAEVSIISSLGGAQADWSQTDPSEPDYIKNKPDIPTALSDLTDDSTHRLVTDAEKSSWDSKGTYNKPSGGIPPSDLSSDVQASLSSADTALQEEVDPVFSASAAASITDLDVTNWNGKTSNIGTITSVKMNGSTISTSGEADLGSVVTDVSGKANKSEMAISTSGDQTTITIASGISATVINSHQSLSGKQDTLVSGTNIKTINNESILGSGNITIQGGSGGEENVIEVVKVNNVALTPDANKAVNVSVPTKVSDLTNDSGFITTESDPTVPSWAKASSKPSYTASEVGAVPTTRTVNGKALSADITLSASDVNALPSSTVIPDAQIQSDWDQSTTTAKDYIKNKPTIPSVVDALNSSSTTAALSANQGKVLNDGKQDKIDNSHKLSADLVDDTSTTNKFVTSSEKSTWNGKANKVLVVNHGTSDTTFELTPNVMHIWGTVSSLTLTLPADNNSVLDEFMFTFTSGSTPTTLSLPSTIKWIQSITIEANKTYQVNIVNNLAGLLTDGMSSGGGGGGGDVNVIEGIKMNNTALTPDANKVVDLGTVITAHQDISGKADKILVNNHGTDDTTYSVTPNTLHIWGEVASLTLTLATPTDATIVNEYMIQFESGSTATTLSLPATVEWAESCGSLSVEASKTYQVSIVNNIGLWAAISNS